MYLCCGSTGLERSKGIIQGEQGDPHEFNNNLLLDLAALPHLPWENYLIHLSPGYALEFSPNTFLS